MPQRFAWLNPPGLTPMPGVARKSGFVLITPGTLVHQRALLFVDTSVTPWELSPPALSR